MVITIGHAIITDPGWGLNLVNCRRGCANTAMKRCAASVMWSTADTKVTVNITVAAGTTLRNGIEGKCAGKKEVMMRDGTAKVNMAVADVMIDVMNIGIPEVIGNN